MNKPKEIIDLNLLESALKTNQIIKNAEVHLSVDGVLTAEIEQKDLLLESILMRLII